MVAIGIALLYWLGCWWFYGSSMKFASEIWPPSTDTIEEAAIVFRRKLKLVAILCGYLFSGLFLWWLLPSWSLSQAMVGLCTLVCLYGIIHMAYATVRKGLKSTFEG